jgi:hypothetical protein
MNTALWRYLLNNFELIYENYIAPCYTHMHKQCKFTKPWTLPSACFSLLLR